MEELGEKLGSFFAYGISMVDGNDGKVGEVARACSSFRTHKLEKHEELFVAVQGDTAVKESLRTFVVEKTTCLHHHGNFIPIRNGDDCCEYVCIQSRRLHSWPI